MDAKQHFLARLRQLQAADRNAMDIYADLAQRCDVPEMKEKLVAIAKDEARHFALDNELIDLVGKL